MATGRRMKELKNRRYTDKDIQNERNSASAQVKKLSRNDEENAAIKFVLLNGSEICDGQRNNRYSAAHYFLLL